MIAPNDSTDKSGSNGKPAPDKRPRSIAALASLKRLPEDFLRSLGLEDRTGASLRRGGLSHVSIPYFDSAGSELFRRERPGRGDKPFHQPAGIKVTTYGDWRLDRARRESRLIFVEGESDCWTLWHHDYPALGFPGAASTKSLTPDHLVGIDNVFVCREPDAGGEAFVAGIVKRLSQLNYAGKVFVFSCPDGVKDPSDLHILDPDRFKERLNTTLALALALPPADVETGDSRSKRERESKSGKKSVSTQLIDLALSAGVELFHDPERTPFATIPFDGRRETHALNHRGFRLWLKQLYFKRVGKSASDQAVQEAVGTLGGVAIFDKPMHAVNVRLAMQDGNVYLDLGDAQWRAVEISPDGWRVVEQPPVKFRRPRGMLPLPDPQAEGRVDELRPFVNCRSDDDWTLIVAWLLAALYPDGPKPVLNLRGQQGAAKSSLGRFLRSLVDPNLAPLRRPPREPRDLAITASNGWLVCLDNLSFLPDWLSDALCCLATGGGFATRELYTNDEEAIFDARRPVLLAAIEDVIRRGDLLDRSISVELEPIPKRRRRTEAELFKAFEPIRPRVLGALLDALAGALRDLPRTRLDCLPRLADFATLVTAAERDLGWKPGTFISIYDANRDSADSALVEDSPLWPPLQKLLDSSPEWLGTAAELLAVLTAAVPEAVAWAREWPKSGRGLSGQLRRLAPSLLSLGIQVEFEREKDRQRRRFIRIRDERGCSGPSAPSAPSETAGNRDSDADGADDGPAPADGCAGGSDPTENGWQDEKGRFGRSDAGTFGPDVGEMDPTPDRGDAWEPPE